MKFFNRKVVILLGTVVVLLTLLVGGVFVLKQKQISKIAVPKTNEIKSETANWKEYRNTYLGFELNIPKEWRVDERSMEDNGVVDFKFILPSQKQGDIGLRVDDPIKDAGHEVVFGNIPWTISGIGTLVYKSIIYSIIHNNQKYVFGIGNEEETLLKDILPTFKFLDRDKSLEGTIVKNDWGVSFMKSANWNIIENSGTEIMLKEISGENKGDGITLSYLSADRIDEFDAKFGPIGYFYDEKVGSWMQEKSGVFAATGKDVKEIQQVMPLFYMNTLPVFFGTGRWKTYIVPLSHTTFLKLNITGGGASYSLNVLLQTLKKI